MRGKYFSAAFLLIAVLLLSACTHVVTGSADELCMYSWKGETDGGVSAALQFDGMQGSLAVEYPDTSMDISGFCIVSDDSLIICDDQTGFDYTFGYKLYGDRVELSFDSGQISLKKMK